MMHMQFIVLAKVLQSTHSLLMAGYVAFVLCILCFFYALWPTIWIWGYFAVIFILIFSHLYVSIRVKLDAELLLYLAEHDPKMLNERTHDLDLALIALKLMPNSKAGRTWTERLNGCKRLFKLQIVLLVLQYAMLMMSLIQMLSGYS
ncbi:MULTISPECIES: hypothetical protein [Acinetobacter]|uniref:hypothetical protein n=2 Tax=Moraxellaceae TaxID=468 RepID=UPI001D171C03|nr:MULTISPECIES: hypothetical protein [Acinetobacter]MCL9677624.1 hypothetical protein [Acinetobacter sp. ACZLY 512]MDI3377018.1 hypothetical protein [Acinetobacter sp. V89_7]WEI11798.1 hypothetical protein PX667_09745 [Acinetobacter soli]WEI15830.1 hypothetical protein PX668_02540 [Acinetobacter soli]